MFAIFFQSLLIGYSGAMMPGALLTYTIEKSMKSGVKAGLLISLGHAMLEFVLVILLFLGAGRYLSTPLAQILIGILGGAVLIYTGFTMIRDCCLDRLKVNLVNVKESSNRNDILAGALVSASNPYLIVWWAAVGLGLIMSSYNKFGLLGIAIFYVGHILSDISWYTFVSFLIGKSRKFINKKIHKTIIIVLGGLLVFFGSGFLITSIRLILH